MNNAPLCSDCGDEEMEFDHSYTSQVPPHYEVDVYVCLKCEKIVEVK